MIFKLQPVFKEKVWGGHKIHTHYQYDCSNQTGEAWGISGHKHGSSIIKNGPFSGKTIRELYTDQPSLFGHYKGDEFPILVKVIDACDDLSIQVHPGDLYARKHENSLGKTECWHILDVEEDTDIIIGHQAKDKSEFIEYIQNNQLEKILNRFKIKKGDEFNIYAGTIHAICKGTLLLEIQQSSDVTYRLYDYNRLSNGHLRELHMDQALDVIKFPDKHLNPNKPTKLFDYHILNNHQSSNHQAHLYGDYLFILDGEATMNDIKVNKGDFLMVTSKDKYTINGQLKYAKIEII